MAFTTALGIDCYGISYAADSPTIMARAIAPLAGGQIGANVWGVIGSRPTVTSTTVAGTGGTSGQNTIQLAASPTLASILNIGTGSSAESHMVTGVSGSGPYTVTLATNLAGSWTSGAGVKVTEPVAYGTTTPTATSITVATSGTWASGGTVGVDAYQLYVDTTVPAVVGGGVNTWHHAVAPISTTPDMEIWWGVVEATGAQELSLTFGGSTTPVFAVLEFGTGGTPTWSQIAEGIQTNASSTTVAFPSLTATANGQLYVGLPDTQNTYSAGSTPGFTYTSWSFSSFCYNPNVSAGSVAPTASQSPAGTSSTAGLILGASSGTISLVSVLAEVFHSGGAAAWQQSISPVNVGDVLVLLFGPSGTTNPTQWPSPAAQGCTFYVCPGSPWGGASKLFNPVAQGYTNTTLPYYAFPAWMGVGQERSYYNDGNSSGTGATTTTVSAIKTIFQADPCFNGAWLDSARPHHPWLACDYQGSSAVAWGTTVGNMVAAGLTGWAYEIPSNEPENGGLGQAAIISAVSTARSAVLAADSTAKCMIYCSAGVPGGSSYSEFGAVLAASTYDYVSMHDESSVNNLGDLISLKQQASSVAAEIAAGTNPNATMWRTETGWYGAYYAVYHPRRFAAQVTKFLLVQELYLGPKEQVYTYTTWIGNGGNPASGFVEIPGGAPSGLPTGGTTGVGGSVRAGGYAAHVMSEALYSTTPKPTAISFGAAGTVGDYLFTGAHYSGTLGDVVVLATNGIGYNTGDTVILNCSSLTGVKVWNGLGQDITASCTISGSKITVPVDDLLTYVFLPASTTVSVVDTGSQVISLLNTATNVVPLASSLVNQASANVTGLSFANTASNASPAQPYKDIAMPASVTASWGSGQSANAFVFKGSVPFSSGPYEAPISFTVSVNGTVDFTYNNPTAITLAVPTSPCVDTCLGTTLWDHEYTVIGSLSATGMTSCELAMSQSSLWGEPDQVGANIAQVPWNYTFYQGLVMATLEVLAKNTSSTTGNVVQAAHTLFF